MTEKRYTVTLGLNNEIEDIIDNCKQGKISVLDFIKQVNEQDKAFKELKKENKKLQAQINCKNIYFGYLKILEDWNKKVEKENKELKEEIETLHEQIAHFMEMGDVE